MAPQSPQAPTSLLRRHTQRVALATLITTILIAPGALMAEGTSASKPPAPFNARKASSTALKAAPKITGKPIKLDALAVQDKSSKQFRFDGEELYFGVEVSGSDAARASLRVGKRQTARGVTFVPVSGNAITHGFFAKSYPADNKADTFINIDTLQPIKADKVIKEKDESRTYKVRYDPKTFNAAVEKTLSKDKKSRKNNYDKPVPASIHDGISWLYELRLEPLKNGDVYTYYIYDGWKLSRFKVTVVGREKAWTPIKEYKAVKVDIERTILNSAWPKGSKNRTTPQLTEREKPYYFSSIHLSDDAQRLPVRIFITTKTADADLKLVKIVEAAK